MVTRKKDKIEKYLDRLIKAHNGSYIESSKSRYYWFCNKCIRISDHVASNSDGNLAIILDEQDKEEYILHVPTTGKISIVNYKELKMIVKSFQLCSSIFQGMGATNNIVKTQTIVKTITQEFVENPNTITPNHVMGIPKSKFTPTRWETIKAVVKKQLKELKK